MRYLLLFCLFLPTVSFALPSALKSQIQTAANRFRIDPQLVEAMVEVESNGNPNAVSGAGAMGLVQVMPRTAEEVGIANPFHALSNLMGACQYMRMLLNRFRFNLEHALAAYNAGPSKVEKYKGVPPYPETIEYVQKVLAAYDRRKRVQ